MHLRKYLEFTRIGIREGSAYRFNAVMALGTSILYLLLYFFIWSAIDEAGSIQGGLGQVMAYLVIGQLVSNTVFMNTEEFFGERIRRGTIVNELKRPMSLRLQTYFYEIGWACFRFVTRGLPVFIFGMLFFDVSLPGLSTLALFGVSMFLSLNLVFSFAYITSMLVFWTKIDWSVRMARNVIQNLFSGVMFPLYLLPGTLETVFNALPFQSMADGPISIYLMQQTGERH